MMSQPSSTPLLKRLSTEHWPQSGAFLLVGGIEACEAQALDYVKALFRKEGERNTFLLSAGLHPDFYCIKPGEQQTQQTIKIDQVRLLNEWVQGTPQIATHKIALISPAEALNVQAASALLKTLEEPPLNTLIILISAEPNKLLPTLRSRCRMVSLNRPSLVDEQAMLQDEMKDGLLSLQTRKIDPITLAEKWQKKDLYQVLQRLLAGLIEETKDRLAEREVFPAHAWWDLLDEVLDSKRLLSEKISLNAQLVLENILIRYAAMGALSRARSL